jgi:hypothetical protein
MEMCQNRARKKALDEEGLFFRMYHIYKEKSLFPVVGSPLEQSASFLNAVEFMDYYSQKVKERNEIKAR